MQRNGKATSLKKRRNVERKLRTGKPRPKSGRRRPNGYDGMQELGKDEPRKTGESQRVNGKVRENSPNSN
jgi:hypothetical protein